MMRALCAMFCFMLIMLLFYGMGILLALSPILIPAIFIVALLWALERLFGGRRC